MEQTAKEARQRLGAIKRIRQYLNDASSVRMYKAFVRSRLEYGNLVYWGAAESHLKKLDAVQNSAKSMLKKPQFLPSLESRRKAAALGLVCKLLDGEGRGELQSLEPNFSSKTKTQEDQKELISRHSINFRLKLQQEQNQSISSKGLREEEFRTYGIS